ncbi:MAG: AAA domain-containing protein [archaeon]
MAEPKNMNGLIKKYQDRLNDLSRRNRAIRISRIVKRKSFDVADLKQVNEKRPFEVVSKLFFDGKSTNLLNVNVKDKEEERLIKDIMYLKRDVEFIEKEKGYFECYLGYPFIQGNFFDESFFRCPLFLIPVRIEVDRQSNKINLKHLNEDDSIQINKTFFLAFNKYNKNHKKINLEKLLEIEDLPRKDLIDWAIKLFDELEIKITKKLTQETIEKIPILTKDEFPKDMVGEVEFMPYSIIGEFSQLNSAINNDYNEMMANGTTNDISELIFGNPVEKELEERFDEEKLKDTPETENFFITQPDISQERVLTKARTGKGLVVHGPPGTGKSQVITNMIADNLVRNKKILMVCEKKAALDVVKNRLASKGLNKYCLLVHDSNNDRNEIFTQITKTLDAYDFAEQSGLGIDLSEVRESNLKSVRNLVDKKSTNFDATLKSMRELIDEMHETKKFGTTLYKLYRLSENDYKYDITLNQEELNKINFQELEVSITKIKKLAKGFYLFENKENPISLRKRFNTEFNEKEFIQKIKSLVVVMMEFEAQLYKDQLKTDLTSLKTEEATLNDIFNYLSELKQLNKLDSSITKFLNKDWWKLKAKYSKIHSTKTVSDAIKRWEEINPIINEFKNNLKTFEHYFEPKFFENIKSNIFKFKTNLETIKNIEKQTKQIEEIILFDSVYKSLNTVEKTIAQKCFEIIPQTKKEDVQQTWEKTIRNSFYLTWIRNEETTNENLKGFSHSTYEEKVSELNKLIKEKSNLIPTLLIEQFQQRYNKLKWDGYDGDGRKKNYNNLKYLAHEVNKKRRRLTIRELFEKFEAVGLLELFPCWMCSPETVSSIFPLKKNLFDIIIFDEASQCRIEKSVPALIRGKKVIVAGDEKQLPPTTFFLSYEDGEEELEEMDEEEQQLMEDESLLIRAKTVLPESKLIYHYRSNNEELINFSNYAFYDKSLRIIPKNTRPKTPPIAFNNVKGTWDTGINQKEATEVVKLIKKILNNKSKENIPTLGIITFNVKQKDLIEDLLEEEAKKDSGFGILLDKERNRYNQEEYIGIFVKNIENVQGDERDIIIFSISYGFDKANKFRYNFGPLNGTYGPNRLNVAISRAKQKVYVITSFEPSELKYDGTAVGPKLLQKYLDYAKTVSSKSKEAAYEKLESLNKVELDVKSYDEYESDFEGEVRDGLTKLGHIVKTQVGCLGYRIDLAIIDPKDKNKFVVGIECDGAKYHSSTSAKDRDIYRQKVLEDAGWKILRIWSRDWWRNEENEIKRIDREIKKLL